MSLHSPVENRCPCGHPCPPRYLELASRLTSVDHYRCDLCGTEWTVQKPGVEDDEDPDAID